MAGQPRRGGWWNSPDLPLVVLGVVLAVGVCWPFFGGGRLFLLDWVMGPHARIVTHSLFGLNGGLTTGLPFGLVVRTLNGVVGAPATWLSVACFFPLATVSMGRLVRASTPARLAAATLFAVNPFVFQRLYAGQIALLLGYALLPLAARSLVTAVDRRGLQRYTPILWLALLTGFSPHFAWICAVLLAGVVCFHRGRLQTLWWAVRVGVGFLATLAYVFIPQLTVTAPSSALGGSLAAFRTAGNPTIGLAGNVAALYGFWRVQDGPTLPNQVVTGWLFLLAALLVVIVAGASAALRDPGRRLLAGVLVAAGVVGFFLAMGGQGPTGPLFRWAYVHVPYFAVMREPEKFSTLLALGYAACFGWGIEALAARMRPARRGWAVMAVVGLALPLGYTPTIFNGLDGQIASSTLPAGWITVERDTASASGRLLSLPWHLYSSFPFTDHRVVADPAPTSYTASVLSSNDAQYAGVPSQGPQGEARYVARLLAEGGGPGTFGALVAPLGVHYVVLSKSSNWRSYAWLGRQADLRLVVDTPSVELYRNTAYAGLGHRGAAPVRRLSPVAYRIPPGPPGYVTVDVPYQPGWALDGHPARQTPEGTVMVWADHPGGVLRYSLWPHAALGEGISVLLVVALGVSLLVARRRRPSSTSNELPARASLGTDVMVDVGGRLR